MVVQRHDGPRWLRELDDDDDDVSFLVGPCCPALLNYINVYMHTVVLLEK